jgi:hypothetical protein
MAARSLLDPALWLPASPATKKGNFARYNDKYLGKKRIIL